MTAEWQEVDDLPAVELTPKMKTRDLPDWFAPIFEHIPGGLPPLRFEAGAFIWLRWCTTPCGDQQATKTKLAPGDFLLALPCGGIDIKFACPDRAAESEMEYRRLRLTMSKGHPNAF